MLDNVPMPDSSTSIVSPARMNTGGLRALPTPPVVPVEITSAGCSGKTVEMYSTKAGTSNIRSLVGALCMIRPLSLVSKRSWPGSGISSAVTIHGPNAPERQKFLPGVNCDVCAWKSRIEPSL